MTQSHKSDSSLLDILESFVDCSVCITVVDMCIYILHDEHSFCPLKSICTGFCFPYLCVTNTKFFFKYESEYGIYVCVTIKKFSKKADTEKSSDDLT